MLNWIWITSLFALLSSSTLIMIKGWTPKHAWLGSSLIWDVIIMHLYPQGGAIHCWFVGLWIGKMTHGQSRQDYCRICSRCSCWSHTQPQSDPGTLAFCRNTSGPQGGSSSIWQVRSRVHMSGRQRWPALWPRGPGPDEPGFPELSQSCSRNPHKCSRVSLNVCSIRGVALCKLIAIRRKLTISSPPHLYSLP